MILTARLLRKVLLVRECVYNDYNSVTKNHHELTDMLSHALPMKETAPAAISFVYVFVLK